MERNRVRLHNSSGSEVAGSHMPMDTYHMCRETSGSNSADSRLHFTAFCSIGLEVIADLNKYMSRPSEISMIMAAQCSREKAAKASGYQGSK